MFVNYKKKYIKKKRGGNILGDVTNIGNDIGKRATELGTNIGNEVGKFGQQITNFGQHIKGTERTLENERLVRDIEIQKLKKEKHRQQEEMQRQEKLRQEKIRQEKLRQEKIRQEKEEEEKKKRNIFYKVKTFFRKNNKKSLKSPVRSPVRSPVKSPVKSPSRTSLSQRSSLRPLNNFQDIKDELNEVYYKIFEIIQRETIFIINKQKQVKTKLQQDLKSIIMIDKNKIVTNLNIILKKKNTLEETLFILSSILRANCEGVFTRISCNVGANLTGLLDIYNLLIDSESLPDTITGKITDIKKLEFIKNTYDNDNSILPSIKDFASNVFTSNKINSFIKIALPVVERLITSKFNGPYGEEPVYGELQQFNRTYLNIKENYSKLSIQGGKKKKEAKRKQPKRKQLKKMPTKRRKVLTKRKKVKKSEKYVNPL
jgi:hypothetical protein